MDRVKKFLKKISPLERKNLDEILQRIEIGQLKGLDVKRMKGYKNVFRIRMNDIRVVFSQEDGSFRVLFVGRRGNFRYKQF